MVGKVSSVVARPLPRVHLCQLTTNSILTATEALAQGTRTRTDQMGPPMASASGNDAVNGTLAVIQELQDLALDPSMEECCRSALRITCSCHGMAAADGIL